MKQARIIKYRRGNHSDLHVLAYGEIVFLGTAKEVKQELVRMRKFLREKWKETSTDMKVTEYVREEMSQYWAFENTPAGWKRIQ